MVTIADIIKFTQPGGENGYNYINVYESACSIEGILLSLEYVKNNEQNEHTENFLIEAREHLESVKAEFRVRVGKVEDESLRVCWLSALETVENG
jgi:hypothetical protein